MTPKELDARLAAYEKAVGKMFGAERFSRELRIADAERRLGELEAVVTRLAARGPAAGGQGDG